MIEEDELQGPLSLNAVVRNLSGAAVRRFTFTPDGITFAAAGSVTSTFGAVGSVGHTGNLASIGFAQPEFAKFYFDNPFGANGKTDWLLSTANLRAGDAFSITAAVPEPAGIALMLLAMGALLAAKRRNK